MLNGVKNVHPGQHKKISDLFSNNFSGEFDDEDDGSDGGSDGDSQGDNPGEVEAHDIVEYDVSGISSDGSSGSDFWMMERQSLHRRRF